MTGAAVQRMKRVPMGGFSKAGEFLTSLATLLQQLSLV